MRTSILHLCLILFVPLFAGINASTYARYEVKVLATYPSGDDVNLGLDDNYSLKIGYKTDEPIRIWARPYFEGERVQIMTNASELYTGEGEALGWFSSRDPVEVDEVRIFVGERGHRGEQAGSYPVKVHIGGGATPLETKPTWVSELVKKTRQEQLDSLDKAANTPISTMGTALIGGFVLAVLGLGICGLVLPVVAFFRWEGGWRVAAAVPMCLMAVVVLRIIIDTAIDPTSHNLWPFELVMFGAVSLGILAVMKIVRFSTRRRFDG